MQCLEPKRGTSTIKAGGGFSNQKYGGTSVHRPYSGGSWGDTSNDEEATDNESIEPTTLIRRHYKVAAKASVNNQDLTLFFFSDKLYDKTIRAYSKITSIEIKIDFFCLYEIFIDFNCT